MRLAARSVEARNYRSDRRETGTLIGQIGETENCIGYQIRKPVNTFRENRKPNAYQRKICKPQRNTKTEKAKLFGTKTEKPIYKIAKKEKPKIPMPPSASSYWPWIVLSQFMYRSV